MARNLIFYSMVLAVCFAGCSSDRELIKNDVRDPTTATEYSVIYYIHADAGYLYHDPDGRPVRANSRVLDTALKVAEGAHSGEVFIIHQRPERKTIGLFPRRNSRFYHFRNGQLINQIHYRHPNKEEAFLATELQLLNRYRIQTQQNYFFYYGHEIPTEKSKGYHRTLPDIDVDTETVAKGIRSFLLSDDQRFDLVVLSTCNNGTPAMAELLNPFTDVLLASPQNLHLSHIDSDSMNILERKPETSSLQLAHSIAEQTYRRLAANIQTTITLAVYDYEYVGTYINELLTHTAVKPGSDPPVHFSDNVDCSQINPFEAEKYRKGVNVWYRPSRFGRRTSGATHSGWGCRPKVINE